MKKRSTSGPLHRAGQTLALTALLTLVSAVFFKAYIEIAHWILDLVGREALLDNWDLATIWYASGVAGALYWPVRHFKSMRGRWGETLELIPGLALFGPLAFIAGLPL